MGAVLQKFVPLPGFQFVGLGQVGILDDGFHKLDQQQVALQRCTQTGLGGQLIIAVTDGLPEGRLDPLKT